MITQSTILTLLCLALSHVSAAPFNLEKRKGGGGGSRGGGGGGGGRGGKVGGMDSWKVVVIVIGIIIGLGLTWWILVKYALPRSSRWRERQLRKMKEQVEAGKLNEEKLKEFMKEKRKRDGQAGLKVAVGVLGDV